MNDYKEINVSHIYSGMMRPAMWAGIPYSLFPLLFALELVFYIGINPKYGLIALPFVWMSGYLLGKYDPDFMGVLKNYIIFLRTPKVGKQRSYRG